MTMITLGQFEYNGADVLGSGAFAIVYKGHYKENPEKKVAIKRMLKDHNILKSKTLLSKEISVLKDLNHENIVHLFDYSISSQGVYLVMEYCNGGDLSDYLHRFKTLSEDTIQHFLIQIGSSMASMNLKGIMHRDLKPGNILLSYTPRPGIKSAMDVPGNQITFKLADFGFARFLQDGMMAVTMCGSPMYMAPEVLMCWKYDALADIWSLGIIVYQCLTGKAPFYANTPEALKNIYAKTPTLRPKIPSTTSAPLKDLLLKMLVRNPRDRIDFKNFLNHPFLKKKEESPPPPVEAYSIKRRNSSGCDLRTISNSPQTANIIPSAVTGNTNYLAEFQQDFDTLTPETDYGGARDPTVDEETRNDYVIVNSDGSEGTYPIANDPARRLFDMSSGSTELSINLLDTCNTSPDYRRHLATFGNSNAGITASPQMRSKSSSVRSGNKTFSYPTVKPNDADAPLAPATPYQIVLKHSNSGDIPRSSPIASPPRNNSPRFYVGGGSAGRHGGSGSPSSNTHSPSSPKTAPINMATHRGSGSKCGSVTPRQSHQGGHVNNINPELFVDPPELSEEVLMEPEHNDEVKKLTMVLELCELLTELSEQRSTPLSECTIGAKTAQSDGTNNQTIKFASEAQRIVEQVVLYKRVLQYLEFFFFQVRTAFQEGKLKATRVARARVKDCNAIYHRCYIRLRHLARDAQREDLADAIEQMKRTITADKLIFQYALDQCSAAEMDDYVGEAEMCLRRYKAAMTLLHGLSQHAKTEADREHLTHYMGLIQDRYARLWNQTVPTAYSPEGSP